MKDWSIEQANEAHRAYTDAGGDNNSPTAPLLQWLALKAIEFWRLAYEAGDTFVVLHAVAECAKHELVMPRWVIGSFLAHYRPVIHCEVKTLDEAFGTFLPKGAHLTAYRKAFKKGRPVHLEVLRRSAAGEAIDSALFESIGKEMGISGSTARDYHYNWLKKGYYKKTLE
jgi:hypothetical protein